MPTSWGDLFDRAQRHDVDLETVRSPHDRARTAEAGGEDGSRAADDEDGSRTAEASEGSDEAPTEGNDG